MKTLGNFVKTLGHIAETQKSQHILRRRKPDHNCTYIERKRRGKCILLRRNLKDTLSFFTFRRIVCDLFGDVNTVEAANEDLASSLLRLSSVDPGRFSQCSA